MGLFLLPCLPPLESKKLPIAACKEKRQEKQKIGQVPLNKKLLKVEEISLAIMGSSWNQKHQLFMICGIHAAHSPP